MTTIAKALMTPLLEKELSDPKMAKLWDLTGKDVPTTQITKKLKVSATKVSDAWKRWERMGLLIKDGRSYRKVV